MAAYTVRPLAPDTWDAYAGLIERHNGVWGGCWCLAFHPTSPEKGKTLDGNRSLKQRLVDEGKAHASVVFDGDSAVGWCQYGTPDELPSIYHRLIARSGGGAVEAFPQDTQGKKVSASFLYNGTRSLFERQCFTYERPKGKNHCVMRATIAPA